VQVLEIDVRLAKRLSFFTVAVQEQLLQNEVVFKRLFVW